MQASGFRDRTRSLHERGVTLLGITFSAVEQLRQWREEVGLTSDLLSDADRAVALAYGAASDPNQAKAARVSVLIGADGRVLRRYENVDAATHPEQVLQDLATMS